jgi:hypothetical protein
VNRGSFFKARWIRRVTLRDDYWGYRVFQVKRGRARIDGKAVDDPNNLPLEAAAWTIDSTRSDHNVAAPIRMSATGGFLQDMVSPRFRSMREVQAGVEGLAIDFSVELRAFIALAAAPEGSPEPVGRVVAVVDWSVRLRKPAGTLRWRETGVRGPGIEGAPVLRAPTEEDLALLEEALREGE